MKPAIRLMRDEDIDLGLSLCRIAGWNQFDADWQTLLALAPDGVFVAEVDGVACGTASTTPYGREMGWIGMVLVHPDFRRHGVGTALLVHCIEHLKARGIESIKLDATDLGRPVYLKLGFVDEREIRRYAAPRPENLKRDPGVRALRDSDLARIASLDRQAFGADRLPLLRLLGSKMVPPFQSGYGIEMPAAILDRSGEVAGYGFARPGHNAAFLGPIVAVDPDAARSIAGALLAELPEGNVFWDIIPDNHAAAKLAESLGFQVTRRLVRMYLGERMNPGEVQCIYGAAGFELG